MSVLLTSVLLHRLASLAATAVTLAKDFLMKAKLMLLGLALAAPLVAADASKILLSGTTVSVEMAKVVGMAKAIVGDMTISADAIAFEKESGTLRCEGAATIRISGNVVTTRDCAIQLSPGDKKLFFLSRGEIQISSPTYAPFAPTDLVGRPSDRENLILEFRARTQLGNEPNKAPEPTPGSVTPRAIEGKAK